MDNTLFFKIAAVFVSAAVIGITYFYVDAQRSGPTAKSLALKTAGALGYVVTGLLSIAATKECSRFDLMIMCALCFSFAGDFFLHLSRHKILTAAGGCFFFAAHICYIAACCIGIKGFAPDRTFFSAGFLVSLGAALALFAILTAKSKLTIKKQPVIVPISIYAAALITMLFKASELGLTAYSAGSSVFAAVNATAGAALFVMSDISLLLLAFGEKHKTSLAFKLFNMYSYFTGQLLLASLTAFI